MKIPLLLVAALLFVWLMVRSTRNQKVPQWARAVQAILVVGIVLAGLYYGSFRVKRAKADIERSRATAMALVEALERYDSDMGAVSAFATPFGAREIVGAVEIVADLASRGEISTLKRAAGDARYCLADVERKLGLFDLLLFSQPTSCRLMFQTLGEPGELADAGVTFEDAAQRATVKQPPGTPGGPACRRWEISTIQVTLPKTKKSGQPWDVGEAAPDPYVALKIGSGKRTKSPRAQDRYKLTWKPRKTTEAIPGSKLEVQVYDGDLIEDDFAFGWQAEVPTHVANTWSVGSHPNTVEFSLSCRR